MQSGRAYASKSHPQRRLPDRAAELFEGGIAQ
jgi:hypothetical protein